MITSPEPPCARLWRRPIHLLALGLGSGCLPVPGTFGTLIAIPLYWTVSELAGWRYLLLALLLFALGIWLCGRTARDLGAADPPSIVWDEMVGYLFTMFAAPAGWPWIVIGFVLFRWFDILKPWPIGEVDRRLEGGLGIMLDDALAGIYACLSLQILARLF